MKKYLKMAALAAAAFAAAFGAFAGLKKYKRAECFGGASPQALAACGWLLERAGAPERAALYERRAAIYAKAGRRELLAADLRALAGLAEAGAATREQALRAYEALARLGGEAGGQAEAAKYRELAAAAGSADPAVLVPLAEARSEAGDWAGARKLLSAARGDRDHAYYNALATVQEGEGDYPGAYATLKAALALPGGKEALGETARHLGSVCYELKKYGEARTYLSYARDSGVPCLECGLLLTILREKAPAAAPAAGKPARKQKR